MDRSLISRLTGAGYHLASRIFPLCGPYELLFGVLITLSLVLRLWDLGARPVHYDESLHAFYSWQLFTGEGYHHEPWIHGPLQFFLNSLVFSILWDDDFTARITYALFGAGLVGLPYFLRGYISRPSTLIASAMLALSPTLLYFSRYSRNDIYMAFWAFALFILMWRYLHERKDRYLYIAAAVMALAFSTKETAYIVIALLGTFLFLVAVINILTAQRVRIDSLQRKAAVVFLLLVITLTLPQWAALASLFQGSYTEGVVMAYSGGLIESPVGLPLWSEPFVDLNVISLHIAFDALILGGIGILGLGLASIVRTRNKHFILTVSITVLLGLAYVLMFMANLEVARNYLVSISILAGITALSIVIGLMWCWRVWLVSAVIFYVIWTSLYTSFYGLWARSESSCPDSLQSGIYTLCVSFHGVFTGAWQGMGYWLAQQEVARGNQPWYYYFVIGSVYEFLPFLLGIVGIVYCLRKGSLMGFALAFWAVATLIAYTIASEKMPWLLVNITLPFIVLTAKMLGDLLGELSWSRLRKHVGLPLILVAPLLLVAGIYLLERFLEFGQIEDIRSWLAVAVVTVLSVALITLLCKIRLATGLTLIVLGVTVLLFGFTSFVSFNAAYSSDDESVEMLVYAGASVDVKHLAQDLRKDVKDTDLTEMVRVDYEIWYPLNWYLRGESFVDYRCYKDEFEEGYVDWCAPITEPPAVAAIVLLDSHGRRDAKYLSDYERMGPFKDLLWFPESYRRKGEDRQNESFWEEVRRDFGYMAENIDDRRSWRGVWDYLIHRELGTGWWSSRFFTYSH